MSTMDNNLLHHPIKFSIKTNDLEKLKKKPDKLFGKIENADAEVKELVTVEVVSTQESTEECSLKTDDTLKGRPLICENIVTETIKKPTKRSHQAEFDEISIKNRKIDDKDQVIIESETSSALVIRGLPRSSIPITVSKEQSILQIFSNRKDVITNKLEEKIDLIDRLCQNSSSEVSLSAVSKKLDLKTEKSKADFKTEKSTKKVEKTESKVDKDRKRDEKHDSRAEKSSRNTATDRRRTRESRQDSRSRKDEKDGTKGGTSDLRGRNRSKSRNYKEDRPESRRSSHYDRDRDRKLSKKYSPVHRRESRNKSRRRSHSKSPRNTRDKDTRHRNDKNHQPGRSLQLGPLSLRDEFLLETERAVVNPEQELEDSFHCSKTVKTVPIKDKQSIAERLQKLFNKTKMIDEKETANIDQLAAQIGTHDTLISEPIEKQPISSECIKPSHFGLQTQIDVKIGDEIREKSPELSETTNSVKPFKSSLSEESPTEIVADLEQLSREKVSFVIPVLKAAKNKPSIGDTQKWFRQEDLLKSALPVSKAPKDEENITIHSLEAPVTEEVSTADLILSPENDVKEDSLKHKKQKSAEISLSKPFKSPPIDFSITNPPQEVPGTYEIYVADQILSPEKDVKEESSKHRNQKSSQNIPSEPFKSPQIDLSLAKSSSYLPQVQISFENDARKKSLWSNVFQDKISDKEIGEQSASVNPPPIYTESNMIEAQSNIPRSTWAQELSNQKETTTPILTEKKKTESREKVSFQISPRKFSKIPPIGVETHKSKLPTKVLSLPNVSQLQNVLDEAVIEQNESIISKEIDSTPPETNNNQVTPKILLSYVDLRNNNSQRTLVEDSQTMHIEKTIIMEPLIKTCSISFRIKTNPEQSQNVFTSLINKKSVELTDMECSTMENSSIEMVELKIPFVIDNKSRSQDGVPITLTSVLDNYLGHGVTGSNCCLADLKPNTLVALKFDKKCEIPKNVTNLIITDQEKIVEAKISPKLEDISKNVIESKVSFGDSYVSKNEKNEMNDNKSFSLERSGKVFQNLKEKERQIMEKVALIGVQSEQAIFSDEWLNVIEDKNFHNQPEKSNIQDNLTERLFTDAKEIKESSKPSRGHRSSNETMKYSKEVEISTKESPNTVNDQSKHLESSGKSESKDSVKHSSKDRAKDSMKDKEKDRVRVNTKDGSKFHVQDDISKLNVKENKVIAEYCLKDGKEIGKKDEQNSEKEVTKDSKKYNAKFIAKEGPKDNVADSVKDIVKERTKDGDKDGPKDCNMEVAKVSVKEGIEDNKKEVINYCGKEGVKSSVKEGVKSSVKEGVKDNKKECANDSVREGVKDRKKEGVKDIKKDGAKKSLKEGSKDNAKEGLKTSVKDNKKDGAKDGAREGVKDNKKEGVKYSVKEDSQTSGKVVVKDNKKEGAKESIKADSQTSVKVGVKDNRKEGTKDIVKEVAKDSLTDNIKGKARDSVKNSEKGNKELLSNKKQSITVSKPVNISESMKGKMDSTNVGQRSFDNLRHSKDVNKMPHTGHKHSNHRHKSRNASSTSESSKDSFTPVRKYRRTTDYSSPKRTYKPYSEHRKSRQRSREKHSHRSRSKLVKPKSNYKSKKDRKSTSSESYTSDSSSDSFTSRHRSRRIRNRSISKKRNKYSVDRYKSRDQSKPTKKSYRSRSKYTGQRKVSKSRSYSHKKSKKERKSSSKYRHMSNSSKDSSKSRNRFKRNRYDAKSKNKHRNKSQEKFGTKDKSDRRHGRSKDSGVHKKSRKSKDRSKSFDRSHRSKSQDMIKPKARSKSLAKSPLKVQATSDDKPLCSESNLEDNPLHHDDINIKTHISQTMESVTEKSDSTTSQTEAVIDCGIKVAQDNKNDLKIEIKERSLAEKCIINFLNRSVRKSSESTVSTSGSVFPKTYNQLTYQSSHIQPSINLSTTTPTTAINYFVNSQTFVPTSSSVYPSNPNPNMDHNNYPLQSIFQPSYANVYIPQSLDDIYQTQHYQMNGLTTTSYRIQPLETKPSSIRPTVPQFDLLTYQTPPPPPPSPPPHIIELKVETDPKLLQNDDFGCTRNSSCSSLTNFGNDMDIVSPSLKSMNSNMPLKLDDDVSDKDDLSSCGDFQFEDVEPQDPFQKYVDAPRPVYEHIIKTDVHTSASGKRFEYAYLKSTKCNCVPPNPDEIRLGKAACDDNCFNRKIKVECNKSCPVYELCTNRRFQEQIYARVEPFYCGPDKGWGIRSLGNIPAGMFVIEYVGELIDRYECFNRIKHNETYNPHFLMVIQKDLYLDAGNKGNWSRFVNHSCDPNTMIEKWVVNGKTRIGFFSKKEIGKDEEITIDYQFQQFGSVEQKCFCSTVNCTGIMGKVNEKLQEQIKMSEIRQRKELIQKIISRKSLKEITHVSEMITVIKENSLDRNTFFNFLEVLQRTSSHLCVRTFIECGGLNVITSYLDSIAWDDWPLKLLYLQCLDHFKLKKRTLINSGFTSAMVIDYWSENPRYQLSHTVDESMDNSDLSNDDSETVSDSLEPTSLSNDCPIQFTLPNSEEPNNEIEKQVQDLALKIKEYFNLEKEKFFIPKIKSNQIEFLNEQSTNDSESKSISIASSVQGDLVQMKTKKLRKKCTEVIQKLPKEEFRRIFSERYNKSVAEKNQLSMAVAVAETNDNDKYAEVFQLMKQLVSSVIIEESNTLKQNEQFCTMPVEFHNLDIDKILSDLNVVEKERLISLLSQHQEETNKPGSVSNYSKSSDDTIKGDQDTSLSTIDQLPPNWKFCRRENGRVYFYHIISKKTQWETPVYPWDAGEDDPDAYDFGDAHEHQISVDDIKYMLQKYKITYKEEKIKDRERRRLERTIQRKLSLSEGDKNKIKFSREVFKAVKVLMKPYFSSSCKIGRVKTKPDLKFLCEKFADTIIGKEVKLVSNLEDLELNSDVSSKIKSYILKYMSNQGKYFKRSKKLKVKPGKVDSIGSDTPNFSQ